MMRFPRKYPMPLLAIALALSSCGADCRNKQPDRLQGYIEGEFVYVASPLGGELESLRVTRGEQIQEGHPLFVLDSVPEQAAVQEVERRLGQAAANLADLRKGRRPTEIEALEAQLAQARVAYGFSERDSVRLEKLMRSDAAAVQEFDRARTARDQDLQRIVQLEADLKTARLGARSDQIEAAEANVHALQASLDKARWDLKQKTQTAPKAGVVFDTLYREGEWVAAGRPVVMLLPPGNIKVRAYVPEPMIGNIHYGQALRVFVDGTAAPYLGTVSYISPRAEFTPPVIYSRESRAKLVFMIEAVFEPETAARLHPGQPIDMELVSASR